VHEGDSLDGWVVTAIAHDRLVLMRDGATWAINLQKPSMN